MSTMTIPAHTPRRTAVVVDDHRTFAELLTMALDAHVGLTCVGVAGDAAAALVQTERWRPDLVIMDYRLGADDGVAVTRKILARWPQIVVVLLTAYPTRHLMIEAADAGASALLPKDGSLADLLEILVSAVPGTFAVPPGLLRTMVATDLSASTARLTHREREVLHLLARGSDVRQISRELDITVNTARGYIKAILVKLSAHTQLEAVAHAHQAGLITSPSPR